MPTSEESQSLGVAQSQENRRHPRRKLAPMAYVELGQDNGGILLNLGEGGFAVQSALALTSRDFPTLRFQVPQAQGWLSASGKVVWISESKKEAGIQFTQLPSSSLTEIRKWVASQDSLPTSGTRNPANVEARTDIYRAPAPRATPPATPRVRTNGSNVDRPGYKRPPAAPAPPLSATIPSRIEPQIPVAEQASPEFHFTDYSMFAADQSEQHAHVWIKPERKGMGWGALTLLALFLSGLFFLLGATLGRATIARWMAYVTGSPVPQASPSPETSASARSEQTPSDSESPSSSTEGTPDTSPTETPSARSGAASTDAQAPQAESSKAPPESRASSATAKGPQDSAVNPRKERLSKNSASSPKVAQSYPQAAPPRSYDDISANPVNNAGEHAILVNAPAPGSPPFFVNLTSDPVSASSTVAISAQRSIAIAPRAGSYGRAQRVVIGKLVAHSDPFYPAEARSKRIQGSVLLHLIIGRSGHIISVTPVRGPNELMNASIAAVREWRYEPTYVDGDPAETQADVTLVFRLP